MAPTYTPAGGAAPHHHPTNYSPQTVQNYAAGPNPNVQYVNDMGHVVQMGMPSYRPTQNMGDGYGYYPSQYPQQTVPTQLFNLIQVEVTQHNEIFCRNRV